MPPSRLLVWILALACFAGCRSVPGGGQKGEEGKPAKDGKDKTDSSYRIHTKPPELFPADLISTGPRPQPDVKKEDIRPAGGAERRVWPPPEGPPPFPAPPPTFDADGAPKFIHKGRAEPCEPVVEALHCILQGKHNEALEHLRKYDPATQELYLRWLPPIAQLSHKSLDRLSPAEVAVLDEQLGAMVLALRPRLELSIGKMCFCEEVTGYGLYKPLPEGHIFVATTPPHRVGDLVQLYVELRNFCSEPRGIFYETRFKSSLEIHNARGERVIFKDLEQKPIQARALLHDYHSTYNFHVPHLPTGTYRLTIQVADETRPELRRVARKSLEFRVTTVGR